MLFGHLLSGCGQMFSDIRTYWSPEAVKRVTGKELTGMAKNGIIHLINSGATTLDATGESHNEAGEPCMKPNWEMTEADVEACLKLQPGIRQIATISVEAVSLPISCLKAVCLSP